MADEPESFRFDRFEIDTARRAVVVDGVPVKLGGRAFDVLAALLERRNRMVSKSELLDLVWANVVVEENTLQVHISALRKVLGPRAISTVPGRGYRFTAVPIADSSAETSTSGSEPDRAAPGEHAVPGALAAQIGRTPLIGRGGELAALRELMSREELVSIVGPSGIGKTRLALELISTDSHGQKQPAVLVEFAPVSDPSLVATTIAHAAGLAPPDASAPVADLIAQLRTRSLLLVLDNCEHLIESVALTVGAIHGATESIRFLATSQEPLNIPGEHVFRLTPLAVPESAHVPGARDYGAVALFESRARDADAKFALTPATLTGAIQICRGLDGIPLAIELAAARVRVLGVEGVQVRLADRFRLLIQGSRTALQKHKTLHAAVDWSYRLLSEPERSLFERLGTFAGGFSLEAAQRIGAGRDGDPWEVLDHLESLIDKSMVIVDGQERPRYRLLETGRSFALERLRERGLLQQELHRHAEVMVELLEREYGRDFEEFISSLNVKQRSTLLRGDLDNLRSALIWASAQPQESQLAVQLCTYGLGLFNLYGLFAEGYEWCRSLRRRVDGSLPALLAARFWLAYCDLGCSNAAPRSLLDAANSAVRHYDLAGKDHAAAPALAYAAMFHTFLGEFETASRRIEEARRVGGDLIITEYATLWLHYYAGQFGRALDVISRIASRDFMHHRTLGEVSLRLQVAYAAADTATIKRLVDQWRRELPSWNETMAYRPLLAAVLPAAASELGLLREADQLFSDGIPIVRRCYGSSAYFIDHLALHLARKGYHDEAARLVGWSDAYFSEEHPLRSSDGRRSRTLVEPMLTRTLGFEEWNRLRAEGIGLDDEAIYAMALSLTTLPEPEPHA
jgi:predicted ATPase/DNA-binding winged helix-turn-helix (wHTH) protein